MTGPADPWPKDPCLDCPPDIAPTHVGGDGDVLVYASSAGLLIPARRQFTSAQFDLVSFIVHVNGGHWVAVVRRGGNWFLSDCGGGPGAGRMTRLQRPDMFTGPLRGATTTVAFAFYRRSDLG